MSDPTLSFPAPSPVIVEPEPTKPTVRRFFFGDDGLRAGWSFLLFVIFFGLLAAGSNLLIAHFHVLPKPTPRSASSAPTTLAPTTLTPKIAGISEGIGVAAILVAAFLMSLVERRPFPRYGLAARRALPDFVIGLFWGLLVLSLLIGALFLTHSIAFNGVAMHGAAALVSAGEWALVFFLVGLLEEFLFRGYFQYTVSRGVAGIVRALDPANRRSHAWGFWVAAFLFSVVLFTVAHTGNHGETAAGIFAVALAGTVFVFSLWRTGSLWWAIGFHTSWDWAQSYLYGTPDSGNLVQGHLLSSHPIGNPLLSGATAGPEGSLLVIPALLLTAAIIHVTLPRRPYFLTPDQSPVLPPSPTLADPPLDGGSPHPVYPTPATVREPLT